ncbi:MAG: hypothetical protein HFI38_11125 [Lachnospiraceae bacterium]|jgi:hypothetical protein|nr:hypothetical protein [Lachnospiraceae bacterium]
MLYVFERNGSKERRKDECKAKTEGDREAQKEKERMPEKKKCGWLYYRAGRIGEEKKYGFYS